MHALQKHLRRRLGIARFERHCRLVFMNGRLIKAYKVPGTREHGQYSRLLFDLQTQFQKEMERVYPND